MNNRKESILALLASIVVLFSAMLSARVSVMIAFVLLLGWAAYKYSLWKKISFARLIIAILLLLVAVGLIGWFFLNPASSSEILK